MKRMQRSLLRLLRRTVPHPRFGVEIGVYHGSTSRVLLDEYQDMHLTLIDPLVPSHGLVDSLGVAATAAEMIRSVRQEYPCRTTWERTKSTDKRFKSLPAMFDFVFIDGDHRYAGVTADIALWQHKVREGGLLCGHDYSSPNKNYKVTQAVDEFVAASGRELLREPGRIWGVVM